MAALKIINLGRAFAPRLPYREASRRFLGSAYELEIIFVPDKLMRNLNHKYRRKNKSTNVLTFGLSKNLGELVLAPDFIKKEARKEKKDFRKHFWHIFLHGLLHLKGFRHGREMGKFENKALKVFSV